MPGKKSHRDFSTCDTNLNARRAKLSLVAVAIKFGLEVICVKYTYSFILLQPLEILLAVCRIPGICQCARFYKKGTMQTNCKVYAFMKTVEVDKSFHSQVYIKKCGKHNSILIHFTIRLVLN